MQHHEGATLRVAAHFHVVVGDAAREPGAQRLQHGLLRGEARSVMHLGVRRGLAVGAFLLGEHLLAKAGRALQDAAHAGNFHDVHAKSHRALDALERRRSRLRHALLALTHNNPQSPIFQKPV